ncbi:TPA: AroM family protein [Klebsiella oxytoca]
MSSASMAILTIGVVPVAEMLPLLTEHIREDQINHISLLGKMAREEVMRDYCVEPGDEALLTLLNDNQIAQVSRQKVERDLHSVIAMLDKQNYDLILLMSTHPFSGFKANNAILLEPQRIIPPLVASIVDGHQVGVIVPVEEMLPLQRDKWQVLTHTPFYAICSPVNGSKEQLLAAGRELIEQGADVLILDCLCYHQQHRDILQKALDIPVLLSNILISRLAAELLV